MEKKNYDSGWLMWYYELQLLKHEQALMLLIWNGPPSWLKERTNER